MMYDVNSKNPEEFINHEEILDTLAYADENKNNTALIESLIEKAALRKGLSHREAAVLLECDDPAIPPGSIRPPRLRGRCDEPEDFPPCRTDQEGFLRQPDRSFCTAVSVQLLYQRMHLLSLSHEK